MTLNEIYNTFITTKEVTLSAKTVSSYKSAYDKHIRDTLGTRDIGTLQYIDYQKFADNLLVSGLKPKTVLNILRMLSSIYSYAIKCDWYEGKNYPKLVELPKFDNKYYVTMSPELQKKYLIALKTSTEPVLKDIFLFLLHGRRLGEVINLEWEYLDLSQGIVYYPASHNKSKKFLSYELTSDLIDCLKELHKQAIERQRTIFPTGYVFVNPQTLTKYSDTGVRSAWRRLLDKNNLPYTKLHNIRHILATYLINELGQSIESVGFVLGHSDTKITRRYVNFKPSVAKNAIDVLFEDFKTKGDKYLEDFSQALQIGEVVQKYLFSDQKHYKIKDLIDKNGE